MFFMASYPFHPILYVHRGFQPIRESLNQRPCITRQWTPAVLCLGWLNAYWKFGGGGSCKERTVPPSYDQSCPAVIWGVLQLWKRRITKWCTLSTASTKLSISGTRRASSLPYFSLVSTNIEWLSMSSLLFFRIFSTLSNPQTIGSTVNII
jgi:hypothetical protein